VRCDAVGAAVGVGLSIRWTTHNQSDGSMVPFSCRTESQCMIQRSFEDSKASFLK
jgi:hypothetical protein